MSPRPPLRVAVSASVGPRDGFTFRCPCHGIGYVPAAPPLHAVLGQAIDVVIGAHRMGNRLPLPPEPEQAG